MITLRGVLNRHLVLGLLIVLLAIAGCGAPQCVEKQVKYYEQVPVTHTDSTVEQETYSYMQPSVEQICGRDFRYTIEYEDKFWIDKPMVLGEINQVKRTVYISNQENRTAEFGFDMIYLVNGTIVERTLNPSMTLVKGEGTRKLYLAWATEYDPGKDVKIDMIDVPRMTGDETCEKVVKYTNMTGVKNKTISSESTSYENVIKTKTVKVCD